MRFVSIELCCLVIGFVSGPISAETYYVAAGGNDSAHGTGSWANALATISNAVSKTADGDTILVSNGVYLTRAEIQIGKGVTVRGLSGARNTIIRRDGADPFGVFHLCHSNAVIEGLTVVNGFGTRGGGGGVFVDGFGGTIANCVFEDNYGAYGGGVFARGTNAVCVIRNCLFTRNHADHGGAVNIYEAMNITGRLLQNCTIVNNSASFDGGGVWVYQMAMVENCVIYGNYALSSPDFRQDRAVMSSCCLSSAAPGFGNMATNPSFADPGGTNFHLLPSSPCVDAGRNKDWMNGTADLDGIPRVLGGAVDIGAYEQVWTGIIRKVEGDQHRRNLDVMEDAGKRRRRCVVVTNEVFVKTLGPDTSVNGFAFYTQPTGTAMMSVHMYCTKCDIIDTSAVRWSWDNGRTWTTNLPLDNFKETESGRLQRWFTPPILHPSTGELLFFVLQGTMPSGHALDGMKHYAVRMLASRDGGKTFWRDTPVLHAGAEFSENHPLPDVWIGKNCFMNGGDPIILTNGVVVFPVMSTRLTPDGRYYNPAGGYTFTDVIVLRGEWERDDLVWTASGRVMIDSEMSTRGMIEPTISVLDGGELIMVMRGSNEGKPLTPSYKWISRSSDEGRTWSAPVPWTYDTGEPFYSPSSISSFRKHSSGRLFWAGNITPSNPNGSLPRYPIVIGEVNTRTGSLIKDSIVIVEDHRPGLPAGIMLSNFNFHEDRETGDLVMYLPHFYGTPQGRSGDLFRYRIEVNGQKRE